MEDLTAFDGTCSVKFVFLDIANFYSSVVTVHCFGRALISCRTKTCIYNYGVQYLLTYKFSSIFTVVACSKESSDDVCSCQLLTSSRIICHAVVVILRVPAVVKVLHELRRLLKPRGVDISIFEW